MPFTAAYTNTCLSASSHAPNVDLTKLSNHTDATANVRTRTSHTLRSVRSIIGSSSTPKMQRPATAVTKATLAVEMRLDIIQLVRL